MNTSFSKFTFSAAAALFLLAAQRHSLAGSATWARNPTNGDWNTAANWRPQSVPNATTDIATFGTSNVTNVTNTDVVVNLDSLVFSPGAPQYTINALDNIELNGSGIVNNSGIVQSFTAGVFFFSNSSTAGNMVDFTTVGGAFVFEDASSAGSGTFELASGNSQATILFFDTSTAGNATINASAFSDISFLDTSTGGNSTVDLTTAASVAFAGAENAEHMTATCIGGAGQFSSQIDFEGFSSAGDGTYTAVGGSTPGEPGGLILFEGISPSADNATFIINGGLGAGLSGSTLLFLDTSTTAAAANITANGGVAGSKGGLISFQKTSAGGTCSITLNGNATLDLTKHAAGLTIGSLAGPGSVQLGANTLTIGSNNQSTTFSGVIQGTGGVTKSGSGTLILSGANTYTGNTTVSAGVLRANNKSGSATSTGSVNVTSGTLGGKGIIAGAVTVGTGSGAGAILQPSVGLSQPVTLTLQSSVTLKADSTYTYKLSTQKAKADQVVANGVTIESGAQFNFTALANKRLAAGTVFTAISNTSATPISGTFANLADGSTLTAGRNKLLVSYTGGDGNDLTLTVQ